MAEIKNERQYAAACERIEELLRVVGNDTSAEDKNFVELDLLSDLVADYESKHYPVRAPTLAEALRLKMSESGLTQKALAELLEISPSRVSEYLTGKSEPTLKIARTMRNRLNIDADVILNGVAEPVSK